MATTLTAQIDFTGPFFQADVEKTLLENVQKMMMGIAEEGAAAARQMLEADAGSRALVHVTEDRVADHVIGRTKSLTGKEWMTAAVVQVSHESLDAAASRSLMAAGAEIERRSHVFRKIASQLRSARATLTANLTAGLE